jgi:6-phosphogluconolactonase
MLTIIEEKDQDRLLQRAAQHLCERLRGLLAGREQVNLAVPSGRNVAKIFQAFEPRPLSENDHAGSNGN